MWTAVHVVGAVAVVGLGAYVGFAPGFAVLVAVYLIAFTLMLGVTSANFSKPLSGSTLVVSAAATVMVIGLAIQAVPYGRSHAQGPVTGEPQWANAETRELMVRACFGCHSNQVEYPSYASVAPISWMVQSHIDEGREAVNYSEFATNPGDAEESFEVVKEGSMPPAYYTRFGLHPEARLTPEEMKTLLNGLQNTPGLTEYGD
jgi:mono/diheme cytochrome c family protein